MKAIFRWFLIAALFGGEITLFAKPYSVDYGNSRVSFNLYHLMVTNVRGHFNEFTASIDVTSKKLNSLEGEVMMSSLDTNNDKRDEHLFSDDFFAIKKFPKARFKMVSYESGNEGGDYDKILADLTIKGITKRIPFYLKIKGPVVNPATNGEVMGIVLDGKINRRDFGVGLQSSNAVVSDDVGIHVEMQISE